MKLELFEFIQPFNDDPNWQLETSAYYRCSWYHLTMPWKAILSIDYIYLYNKDTYSFCLDMSTDNGHPNFSDPEIQQLALAIPIDLRNKIR